MREFRSCGSGWFLLLNAVVLYIKCTRSEPTETSFPCQPLGRDAENVTATRPNAYITRTGPNALTDVTGTFLKDGESYAAIFNFPGGCFINITQILYRTERDSDCSVQVSKQESENGVTWSDVSPVPLVSESGITNGSPLITNELRLTVIAHHRLRLKFTVSKSMFGRSCGIQLLWEEPYISVHYTALNTGEHIPTEDGSTVQPLPSMVTTVRTSTANPTQKDIQSEQTRQIADTAKSPTTTATPPRSSNFLSGPTRTIAATSTATTAAPTQSSNFLSDPTRTIAATSTATTATPLQSSDSILGPISTVATTKTSSSRPYPVVSTSVSTTASRPAIVSGNSNLNIILALSVVVIILLLVVVCLVHRKRRQSPQRTLIHLDGSTELSTNHCRSETPARDHHHATGVDPGKVLSRDLLADNALRYEQAHDDGVIRVYAVCGPAAPIETPQPVEDRTVETKITSTQPSMHAYEYITTPPTDAGIEDMVNDFAELEVDTSPSDPSTVVASMFGPIPGMVHESDSASDTLHTKGESAAISTMNQGDTRFAEAPYSNLKFPALGKSSQDTSGEITPATTALPPVLPEEDHSNSLSDHNITSLRNRLPSEYLVPMDL